MKNNMGMLDKSIRIIIAAVLVYLVNTNVVTGTLSYVLSFIAITFVITSFIGFCPVYLLWGINSAPKEEEEEEI